MEEGGLRFMGDGSFLTGVSEISSIGGVASDVYNIISNKDGQGTSVISSLNAIKDITGEDFNIGDYVTVSDNGKWNSNHIASLILRL